MSNTFIKYRKYKEDSFESFDSCRKENLNRYSSNKLKTFYSETLLPTTDLTYNAIAEIETELSKPNLSTTERKNLNNLLITFKNRLKKLHIKGVETQNFINTKTNTNSQKRDFIILVLSVIFSILTGVRSSNEQLSTIKTEINTANSESTTQIIKKIDKVDALNREIESQKILILDLINRIDSLANKKKLKKK